VDERVQGSLFVYERFDKYKPREDGEASFTSGPKVVHFDRVEWHVQPEPATKAAAIQAGEMDWWENPPADLLPLLKKNNIRVEITDRTGGLFMLRPNHLYPPFDKPAVRRALLGAIDQKEFMVAMQGHDTSLWSAPCGFFPPVSPLATDAGLDVLTGKRDYPAVKAALEKAGYKGEKVVLMGATDQPQNYPLAEVAADVLKRVGVDVDYQATDWGMVVQRRALTKPPAEGGWNLFCTGFSGLDFFSPASHLPLRGNGKSAWFGWPDDPKIEALREAWFNAPDLAAQKKVCAEIQLQAFENVPYYPLGVAQSPTAFRPEITGVPEGFVIFWNVRRA
jgi:peptide/nickel transport system substrate-binding protein